MSENLMHFDDTNLDSHISGGITLVDFYADWCGPCKTLSPIIEKIAATYKDVIRVGKMDVEESPETSKKYLIISIPTVIFFKDGEEVSRFMGVKSIKDISSIIDGIVNK